MATKVSTRISELWKELSVEDRHVLAHAAKVSVDDEAAAISSLSNPDAIIARVQAISEEHADLLYEVCFESGLYVETFDPAFDAQLRELMDAGLVLPYAQDEESTTWVAPLEVRTALVEEEDLSDADLALQLYFYDDDALDALIKSHHFSIPRSSSRPERLEAIVQNLLDPEHLDPLLVSLSPAAIKLLLWIIQHDGPVAQSHSTEWLYERAETDGSMSPAVLSVLERLGLIQPYDRDALPFWVIASDLRSALLPLLTVGFNQPASTAWVDLRDSGQPCFRDTFPRGAAGSPLIYARYRLMRCISEGMDTHSNVDRLLREFFVYDEHHHTKGALSSYQLDVQTPDAFARHMLRVWTGSLDDGFTRALIGAFEGDVQAISHWFIQNPPEATDEGEGFERQLWLELLVQLRGLLIISLGCLSPGVWYSLDHLTEYVTAIYRRTVWQYGRYRLFTPEFPHDALPVGTEELQMSHRHALQLALTHLFEDFLEVIGAAQRDASGQLFIINNEAFRVFRESDQHFEGLWEAAETILQDDIDLWLPLPNEPGPRAETITSVRWFDDGSLWIDANAPLSDLVRLAEWGTPHWEGDGFRFTFNTQSFLEDAEPSDIEELLLWLVVRAERPLPDVFRSLVPLSYSEADAPYEQVRRQAEGHVTSLVHALEAWGESPSLAIMEELRSWGAALSDILIAYVQEAVEQKEYDAPLLRHAALLLGELGDTDAVPALLQAFTHCTDDRQEGALGMALARMGAAAFNALQHMLYDPMLDPEKRLSTAGVLTSMGVLFPHLKQPIFQHFRLIIRDEETRDDVATILAVYAADLGHLDTDNVIRALQNEGRWVEDVMPFEDALWTSAISPCNWGHPIYAGPLAQIFPNVWESEEVVRDAGIDDVIRGTSVDQATVLGRSGGWRRRT